MTTLSILYYAAMIYLLIGAVFALYIARKSLDLSGFLEILLAWPWALFEWWAEESAPHSDEYPE